MTRLFFCQNDVLLGESFWQNDSLVTFILFELCLLWYLAQSQILVTSLYLYFWPFSLNLPVSLTLVFYLVTALSSAYNFEKMLEQGIIDGFYLIQTWNQQTWFVLFILFKNSSASYFQFGIKIELYILMAFLVHRSPSKVKNKFWTAGKKNWISAWNTMFWCSIPKRNSNFLLLCVTFSPSKMVLYIFPPTW